MVGKSTAMAAFLILFVIAAPVFPQDFDIDVYVEEATTIEGRPIKGMLSATHPSDVQIDLDSFKLDGEPLNAKLIKKEAIGPLAISLFSFMIDPKPRGLHLLPGISFIAEGKSYRTSPISYTVAARETTEAPPLQGPLFLLKAFYEGPHPLYPGQRGVLVYQIFYNRSIKLTHSELPFLEPEGFRTIGDVQIQEFEKHGVTLQEIRQEIEAVSPGTYTFGPSILEGFVEEDPEQTVRSKAGAVFLPISPFPQKNKPLSFTGAIGNYRLKTELLSPPPFHKGETLKLELVIKGEGNLDELRLPELLCQPGFSGLFSMDRFLPAGAVENGSKRFLINLRPLSALATEIPPIEFSFFDPKKAAYETLKSLPIPLKIESPLKIEEPAVKKQASQGLWRNSLRNIAPADIFPIIPLKERNLRNPFAESWKVLFLIPFGAGLLALQIWLRDFLKEQNSRRKEIPKSFQLYLEAKKSAESPGRALPLLKKALTRRLQEAGLTQLEQDDLPCGKLSQEGLEGKIRGFLLYLEEIQFGKLHPYLPEAIFSRAEAFFNEDFG